MSLLKYAFRAPFLAPGPRAQPPAEPEAARPAAPVPGKAAPAWRLLDAQTGVQDVSYGDSTRPGIQRLFRQPPRRLLDIGCAAGAVAAGFKKTIPGLWAWGCELNEQSARVAATRLDHVTGVPREQWGADDLARIASVDTVLLLDVLEHMYNPWAELEFLAQRLPADAQVIVSLPNIGHLDVLQALAMGSFPYAPMGILDVTHVRFFTFDGMLAMFRETGFEVEETSILSRNSSAPGGDFPAEIGTQKLMIKVENAQEWDRLMAIQFGFRLRPRR